MNTIAQKKKEGQKERKTNMILKFTSDRSTNLSSRAEQIQTEFFSDM